MTYNTYCATLHLPTDTKYTLINRGTQAPYPPYTPPLQGTPVLLYIREKRSIFDCL